MPRYLPQELQGFVEQKAREFGTVAFLTQRRNQRLREMWCAATFSRGYAAHFGSCHVDIAPIDEQRDYDFHLVVPMADPLPFQVTEVLDAGRRRSAEYLKNGRQQVDELLNDQPFRGSSYASLRLREVVATKVAKRYAGSQELHLLAYMNLKAGSVPWPSLASAVEFATPSFASIWAITEGLVACLHGGRRWAGKVGWKPIASAA